MNKVALSVAAVAIAGGAYYFSTQSSTTSAISLPSLSSSELSELVASQTAAYEADGFTLNQETDGSFSLVIKDEMKVRIFLMKKLETILPKTYEPLLDELTKDAMNNDEKVLEGLTFEMKVIEQADGAKLQVTLKSLPTPMMTGLMQAQDPASLKVKSMLEQGKIAYILSMDKEGSVNGIALKDIDETFNAEGTKVTLKSEGIWSKFTGDINSKFKLQEGIKTIAMSIEERGQKGEMSINGIEGFLDQTTPLDQVSTSSVDSILFNFDDNSRKVFDLKLSKLTSEAKSESANGFLNSGFTFKSTQNSFTAKERAQEVVAVDMKNFIFALKASHISEDAALALQSLAAASNPAMVQEDLEKALQKLVHSGLNFDLDALGFDALTLKLAELGLDNLAIRDLHLDLHIQLKENSIDFKQPNPMQILPFIQAHGKLVLNDEDLQKLVALQPMAVMVTGLKKMDGNLAVFEFEFTNGQFKLNGAPLPGF